MAEDQKGALCRQHTYVRTRLFSYCGAPYSGRIDRVMGIYALLFARADVAQLHSDYRYGFLYEIRNLPADKNVGSVQTGVKDIGCRKAERVNGCVRHLDGAYDIRIYGRLEP